MSTMKLCSIEGCERPHYGNGWCSTHNARVRRNGTLVPQRIVHPAGTVCSIEGCERPHFARGWCSTHYGRWKRNGTLDSGIPIQPRKSECTIDGCDSRHYVGGFCRTHYDRHRRHGDPHKVILSARWTGDDATYAAVHQRLRRMRGSASSHTCPCGSPAKQWSYDREDPDERVADEGPYSVDPDHYIARCVPCHKRFDLDALK